MNMSINKKILAVAVFILAVFVVVPLLIGLTGRKDFYYTLTSVALLSIAIMAELDGSLTRSRNPFATAVTTRPAIVIQPMAGLDGPPRSPFWNTSINRTAMAQTESTISGSSAIA